MHGVGNVDGGDSVVTRFSSSAAMLSVGRLVYLRCISWPSLLYCGVTLQTLPSREGVEPLGNPSCEMSEKVARSNWAEGGLSPVVCTLVPWLLACHI